jgi:phage terminase large subunit-like protein
MKLSCDMIEALAGVYLSPRYDQPQPTPEFHRECWTRYCSDVNAAATAAPRNHAKSTALTHDYGLATALFRIENYIIIVGSSEELAIEHMGEIANELRENEDLIRDFHIKGFLVDQKTDIIIECTDGYQFRFLARGAEQKLRGRKWQGRRPGLILCDDLEDDEQVESRDRRRKFRRWFFRACKQALRDGGKIRVHGTILHEDSLLNHLMKNPTWNSKLYKAHKSFSEFTHILWPEKFPEARLRAIRQEFVSEGDAAGYSQEYLNDPRDNAEAYFRRTDFIAMEEQDYETFKIYRAAWDFAISKADSANRTSCTVGGKDINNILHIVDERVKRMDIAGIIDEIFSVETRWHPDCHFVEDGVIWKAILPLIEKEMARRDIWIAFEPCNPMKDKKVRGRSLQKRMRAGGCRFDKNSDWYDEFEDELLRFTGESEALLDDQVDSASWLSYGFELVPEVREGDDWTPEEEEFEMESRRLKGGGDGRSLVTGY